MYLVTGGAGFIGLNLVIALQARQAQSIAVCDRLDHANKIAAMQQHKPSILVDPEQLENFLAERGGEIEAVFHLGAISSTTEPDWSRLQKNNIDATLMLWHWCAATRVPLIYASSASTYGDGSKGFDDADDATSLQRLDPLSLYAKSKHQTDLAIRRLLDQNAPAPPQWAGLKFFNVYGPHERHKNEQRSIVCVFYDQIIASGRPKLFRSYKAGIADGGQLRDFITVQDCVDVMLWLADSKRVSGLFNIGTGKARSFDDVAKAIFAALHRAPDIEFIDMPVSLRDKYQYYTQAEISRLRAAGYRKEFTTLEDGVARYVRDYLAKDVV